MAHDESEELANGKAQGTSKDDASASPAEAEATKAEATNADSTEAAPTDIDSNEAAPTDAESSSAPSHSKPTGGGKATGGKAISGKATGVKATGAKSGDAKRPQRVAGARKSGFSARNVIAFSLLVAGLLAAFGLLGTKGGEGGQAQPSWKVGQVANVEITLVSPDFKNLACAMEEEVAGKHCAFAAANKRHEKATGTARDDANLLQPVTTTDRVQFLVAGLFTQPALKEKLDKENFDSPGPRFAVTCKLTVDGKAKAAQVQWKPGDPWYSGAGWYTGTVSDCAIAK